MVELAPAEAVTPSALAVQPSDGTLDISMSEPSGPQHRTTRHSFEALETLDPPTAQDPPVPRPGPR